MYNRYKKYLDFGSFLARDYFLTYLDPRNRGPNFDFFKNPPPMIEHVKSQLAINSGLLKNPKKQIENAEKGYAFEWEHLIKEHEFLIQITEEYKKNNL